MELVTLCFSSLLLLHLLIFFFFDCLFIRLLIWPFIYSFNVPYLKIIYSEYLKIENSSTGSRGSTGSITSNAEGDKYR